MNYKNLLNIILIFEIFYCQAIRLGKNFHITKNLNYKTIEPELIKTKYFHYKYEKHLKLRCPANDLQLPLANISWFYCHLTDNEDKCKEQQFMTQSEQSMELKLCNSDISQHTQFRCKACDSEKCSEHIMEIYSYNVNMPPLERKLLLPLESSTFMECSVLAQPDDIAIIWLRNEGKALMAKQQELMLREFLKEIENRASLEYDELQKIFENFDFKVMKKDFGARSYLPLLNITTCDEGSYACLMLSQRTVALHNFDLKINSIVFGGATAMAPQITTQMKSIHIDRYEYFILQCLAIGEPRPSITWYLYGEQVNCDLERITCIGWSIIVHHPNMMDTGEYSCKVCNSLGCVRQQIEVEMRDAQKYAAALKPIVEPAEYIAYPLENIKFQCKLPSHVEYMLWLKHSDPKSLDLITKLNIVDVFEDKFSKFLQYHNITLLSRNKRDHHVFSASFKDMGWYTCVVFASFKKGLKSAYLSYTNSQHPEFITKSNDITFRLHRENDQIQLSCAARALPAPQIQWSHNDNDLSCNSNTMSCNDFDLRIAHGIYEDSGIYKCKVCNTLSCIERSFSLTINPILPRGKNRLKHLQIFPKDYKHVNFKSNATFICRNDNLLLADISTTTLWLYFQGGSERPDALLHRISFAKAFSNANNVQQFLLSNNLKLLQRELGAISILNLSNIQSIDQGWYICAMFSKQAEGMQSVMLEVNDEHKPVFNEISASDTMENLNIDLNDAVILHCPAKANPLASITWFFNNSELDCMKEKIFCKDWSINIVNATQTCQGIYKCKICNKHGCIERQFKVHLRQASVEYSSWSLISLAIVTLLSLALSIYIVIKCYAKSSITKVLTKSTETLPGTIISSSTNSDYAKIPCDSEWEIPRETITIGSTLGEGYFGRVKMGTIRNFPKLSSIDLIAIKMLKPNAASIELENLIKELNVMKSIGCHKNILQFLGCCSQNGPLWLIVEYAENGNLKNFLTKNAPTNNYENFENSMLMKFELSQDIMLGFCYQIAQGMEYLNAKHCIHRDLAARNILLDSDHIIKICDFGLAHYLQVEDYYYQQKSNGPLPLKWMAPESMENQIFNTKSDIWSYGVVLWEIWSYGAQPYAKTQTALSHYNLLVKGERLPQPDKCPTHIYEIMQKCWQFKPEYRPTFSQLVSEFSKLIQNSNTANEGYVDMFELRTQSRMHNLPTVGYLDMSRSDFNKCKI